MKNVCDPIFFAHFGTSWYLESVFKCARTHNPKARIILLGDRENMELAEKHGLEWKEYKKYGGHHMKREFEELGKKYRHVGSAPAVAIRKHRFNFQRWYRIYDACREMGVVSFWYFDSDTLICRDLSDIENYWHSYPMCTINRISGCAMKVNALSMLRVLCYMIYDLRRDEQFVQHHRDQIVERRRIGKHYNLCDMSIIREFADRYDVGELSDVVLCSVFDPNMNIPFSEHVEGYPYAFEMSGRSKRVYWDGRVPHFHLTDNRSGRKLPNSIRANTLNCSWYGDRREVFFEYVDRLI